jgi:AsmA protein
MVLTPANVSLKIDHLDLTTSGVLENSPEIAGLVALDGNATSDGKDLDITGKVKAEKLKLVKGGSPAKRPLEVDVTLSHDLKTESGLLKRGSIHIGAATASLVGLYNTKGESTFLRGNLNGLNMPLPELEAMLPALNITLPAGSSLQGGTASIKFAVEGLTNQLVATGSLALNNTKLAGFDLGQKMSVIEKLAGIKGGPNTDIETLSANVRASQQGGATLDDIKFVAPAIGELNGAGTVSPANALDFKMKATVHTSGVMAILSQTAIPFFVQGTASNPVFKPDVKGLATQELKSVKSDAVKTGLGLLNEFLDKKKK